jgi:hypothetical protein
VWLCRPQTNVLTPQHLDFRFQDRCRVQQRKPADQCQPRKADEHMCHSDLNKENSTMIGMESYGPSYADILLQSGDD